MAHREMEGIIKSLLWDVLEQCARHMDAVPDRRAQFKPIELAVHAALQDFERQFSLMAEDDQELERRLLNRAQQQSFEWLLAMQELRLEPMRLEDMADWPTWNVKPTSTGHWARPLI